MTHANPHNSAILDVQSAEKGFLPPRMSTIERETILNPATGLVVYDADENSLYLFDGTEWLSLVSGTESHWETNGENIYRINGNVGIGTGSPQTQLHLLGGIGVGWQVERNSGALLRGTANLNDASVGTQNSAAFRLITNNTVRLHVATDGKIGIGTVNPVSKLEIAGDLKLENGSAINGFSTSTALGSSNMLVPTENAVKTYVDNAIGSITESDPSWNGPANTTSSIGRAGNVGIGTDSPTALLHISGTDTGGGNVLFIGELKDPDYGSAPIEGAGTRMMWYPDKAAFRAGLVNSSEWNTVNIGLYSVALGRKTIASGVYSTALGGFTIATNYYSTAMGSGTIASGSYSTAMGSSTHASGSSSFATGSLTTASGTCSIATGFATTASGTNSSALGYITNASGYNSTAIGSVATASGSYSIAMGGSVTAKSGYETVMGSYNTDYTPNSTTGWDLADRLFVIGNGPNGANTSDALVVLKNGNTGIGISNPVERLEVKGNIHVSDGNRTVMNRSNNSIGFGTNNLVRLHITNAGNIGIGTTTPNERLEVDGNIHVSGGNRSILNRSNNALSFGTNNQERMRINSLGNIGIGTDVPFARLQVEHISSSTIPTIRIHNTSETGFTRFRLTNQAHEHYWDIAAGGANNYLDFYHNGAGGNMLTLRADLQFVGVRTTNPAFTLHVNGDAGKPGGGSWANASDARLKTNVQDFQGSLENLLKLRGVTFLYNDPEAIHELPGERIGMIAQEVAEIFPDWVTEGKDGYLRLTYRGFEALVVEALRELREEKDTETAKLRYENEELRAQFQIEMNELAARIKSLEILKDNINTHADINSKQ